MKLLIVEDDSAFASMLKRRMEKYGYSCWLANNINDALLTCHRQLPEFILLDMKLHHESGLNLITPMRKLLPHSRIILLTGFASIATAVDAIKLGADDYLTKPVDTQTLLSALAKNNNSSIKHSMPTFNRGEDINNEPTLSTEQVEWEHIQQVLKFNNGNVSATARQLSMHRRTLQRKLQKKPTVNTGAR
ncbi:MULTISPECIES: response regulator transcription factor [unclassified Colwellia]|uniref:response regulator transcription factor n=1 Tax=unclassified Colwellia TaxID=196834 RepID=UPI0015F6D005|nr:MULTISPECIES: response regulator [unclassified Colwellia]MBA6233165.1 response regulator [Colwellia sp. MB02u-7]MBA6236255.1 response regulator [Colwellia sp. MB02u-11]MBA6256794.1 response regulator [Colwellia sp. MB3u-28]MBA6261200.1 response regulator [Colwellia sp. MB3u-41]MBA6298345.1 response regulator [Colwellia sp. MB3u-22]